MINKDSLQDFAKDRSINYGKKEANEVLSSTEKFNETLSKIKESWAFKKLEDIWWECSEEDKNKVYKSWQQKWNSKIEKIIDPFWLWIIDSTKQADPILSNIQMLRYKNNKLKGLKLACPPQTFEPTMRLFVHMWLLKSPEGIDSSQIINDLKSDTKTINMKLKVFQAVATVVPQLRPILPLVKQLRTYSKKLWDVALEKVLIENNNHCDNIEDDLIDQGVLENTETWVSLLKSNIDSNQIKEAVWWSTDK